MLKFILRWVLSMQLEWLNKMWCRHDLSMTEGRS
jgi:hypothetical protein